MTREEAIAILQDKHDECKAFYDLAAHPEDAYPGTKEYMEALQMALAALRGPTRERVEKLRGEWVEDKYSFSHCSLCKYEQEEPELISPFCANCGAPMTDEAVDIVIERLEALKDETTAD